MPPSTPPHQPALWTPAFVALLAVNLLLCFGFYMLPATLPAHVKLVGGSHFEASLVIGMFSITSLAARVISGTAVDAIGERRLIGAGILIIAATTLAFIWLPIDGILLLRSLQGIGWGLSTAAIATAVYKIVPEARRGEGSGYYVLTVITALSLTPLVAILLMETFSFDVLLTTSALFTLSALALLRRGLSTLPAAQPVRHEISLRNVFEPGAVVPSLLCFINSVPLCGVMVYLVLFGRERQIDNLWVFFIGYTLMILLTRPAIGRLFDRKGHLVIIVPGCLAMMLGLAVLSLSASTSMLVAASLLYGLGYGAVHPSLQTWAVNRCPPNRKAAANGLFMSAIDLGYIVGAISLGHLAKLSSYSAMYLYSTGALVVFLAVYLAEVRKRPSAL
ncbi:MFS transporter [Propionivibrio limicola]|uniref:MFS transporter n=1 Tax=Propionivibrio limicola TaxID=167645 RepID=UPI00147825E9|nr:MFS transporter [Propionivibrio limicola]